MKKNIVFSTTRQWNPGDEIILKGIINLLKSLKVEFNPIIFNRNPDIRSACSMLQYGKKADLDNEQWHYVKSSMLDNSIKQWTDYTYIDAIIFAGTPEWLGTRNRELYINAIKYHIPVYFIGIDSAYRNLEVTISSVLKKAKFLSVRNHEIEQSFNSKGIYPYYLPCPSIFASETEKEISKVECIGLIYRGLYRDVTLRNGWSQEEYTYQNELFREVIKKYKSERKVIIICHYIDELHYAQRDFPEEDIRYSYDSADYMEIYKECDIVIGSRIHGIGIATSLGIPSIPIKYDSRGGTIDGFYPDSKLFENLKGLNALEECFSHIKEMNRELIKHKKETLEKYKTLLADVMDFEKVKYDYNLIQIGGDNVEEVSQELCKLDKTIYNQRLSSFIQTALKYVNDTIEGKRVVIKGGGSHTVELLKYLTSGVDIVCIVDKDRSSFGEYPVVRNDEIKNLDFDYVLISSHAFEHEMIEEMNALGLSDKVISLYRIIEDSFGKINREFYNFLTDENCNLPNMNVATEENILEVMLRFKIP